MKQREFYVWLGILVASCILAVLIGFKAMQDLQASQAQVIELQAQVTELKAQGVELEAQVVEEQEMNDDAFAAGYMVSTYHLCVHVYKRPVPNCLALAQEVEKEQAWDFPMDSEFLNFFRPSNVMPNVERPKEGDPA